uniref:Uncharacterized protein n=1 Tax=Picea glauca TaxID=3330 RepID=A0A117NHM7_PICGL|nr:hypothetical protein ABT39_MTgene4638 [Picea glauca]QHR92475.1 hypothetical protein Q903MT_gene6521 [Picea sitchensis]
MGTHPEILTYRYKPRNKKSRYSQAISPPTTLTHLLHSPTLTLLLTHSITTHFLTNYTYFTKLLHYLPYSLTPFTHSLSHSLTNLV